MDAYAPIVEISGGKANAHVIAFIPGAGHDKANMHRWVEQLVPLMKEYISKDTARAIVNPRYALIKAIFVIDLVPDVG